MYFCTTKHIPNGTIIRFPPKKHECRFFNKRYYLIFMKLKKQLFLLLMSAALTPVKADEGMWLLPLLKQQNAETMKQLGLNIDIDDIYHPDSTCLKDAVVIFGGGCTGEIISPEGLLLTNHHCGYGSIQKLSSVEHNYLEDGFWATNKSKELPVEGLTVQFVEKIEDVTEYVKKALAEVKDPTPTQYLSGVFLNKLAQEKIGKSYLNEHPWIRVEIKPLYDGNLYYMYTYKVYSDIRLVGTPPSSIGKFGADTDNWMWPRHTCDFSLFRIYTDPAGNPASYHADNVPLKPKKYFNLSIREIKDNDYTMVIGFPGSTNQFYTSQEVKLRRDVQNAIRIEMRGIRQAEMLDEMLADEATRIQYASKYAGSSNYWKNSIGMNRGIDNLKVIEQKEQEETAFKKWAQSVNRSQYADALDKINEETRKLETIDTRIYYLTEGLNNGVEFKNVPYSIANRLKKALESKNQTEIDKAIEALKNAYRAFNNKDYNRKVDKRVSKAMIAAYAEKTPPADRPEIFNWIEKKYKGDYNTFVDEAFKKSIFGSDENFDKFIKKPTVKAIENDPMIRFAQSVDDTRRKLYEERSPITQEIAIAKKIYTEGWLEMNKNRATAPDANFTMRLTFGQVLPYRPKDGVEYKSTTTLTGVMEKEDPDNWEFVVPDKLKQLYRTQAFGPYANADGTMPNCFISNNDITGGNSGSPVINANGELIGAAFDGNWEAMSGDIVFEPDLQRTISVDIRYILFIIDKFADARHLLDEMTIVK